MPTPINLTFDPGAPLDATKLNQLVTYLNQINAETLTLPSQYSNLANTAIAQRMTAGVGSIGSLNIVDKEITKSVTFKNPLTSTPAAIICTIETSYADADLIGYLKPGYSNTGFTFAFNRVAGTEKTSVATSLRTFTGVKLHYFAIASV